MDSPAGRSASGSFESIEEAAIRWFTRKQSGSWSVTEQAEFDSWIAASTAHRIHYLRAETSWKQAARMRALGAGVPAGVIPQRGSWGDTRFFRGTSSEAHPPDPAAASVSNTFSDRRKVRLWRPYLPAAAAVLIAVGGYLLNGTAWRGDRFVTPVGGVNTVPLTDGSQVTLNTNSRIRVALDETERRVDLDQGEAFFDVAKDNTRPFVVHAGDRRIVVLGTKFSVRREGDEVQVVVTEGRVRLEGGHSGPGEPTTLLAAGAVARTARAAVIVQERPPQDVTQLLSWRSGYVSFRNTELAKAVEEFNRYSTRKIVIDDPSIADMRIGGNFRTNNADAFLWLIENGFPVKVEHLDDRIVLIGK